VPPPASDTERAVGRYLIVGELGRGGMAVVYMARQRDLDRLVALKELALLPTAGPSVAGRFLREARLAGSLSHPNIVTVHEYFEYEAVPFIAMEYLERGSLRRYVNRLSLAQMGGVLEGVLAGLDYASKRQIVHRDIKPENVMINADGQAKIADFGIATATNIVRSAASMTAPGTAVGTPNYMAPEQATARGVGPTTDIYAVGVMAFEMIVGRPPFSDTDDPIGVMTRQVTEPIPPVTVLRRGVDPGVSDWIQRLTAKDPSRRPTASAAWDELEERLLFLLGPRWRRQAPLGTAAAGAAAMGAPAMGRAATGPTVPLRNRRRSTQKADAAAFAATAAPQAMANAAAQPIQTASRHPWRRWLLPLALLMVAAGAGFAAATRQSNHVATSPNSGVSSPLITAMSPVTTQPPATTQPPTTTATTTSPESAALASVPPDATSTTPAATPASLAKQKSEAKRQAKRYADAANQAAALAGGQPASAALTALIDALNAVSAGYTQAAKAAGAGDLTGYAVATADINRSKDLTRQAIAQMTSQNQSGGSDGTTPSDQSGSNGGGDPSGSDQSGVGDSQSDDPSDDQP
jgi:hypothetical protein